MTTRAAQAKPEAVGDLPQGGPSQEVGAALTRRSCPGSAAWVSHGRRFGGPAALAGCALLPLVMTAPIDLQVLTIAMLSASLAVGLIVSLGYTGLLSLSQGTFYGVGAYTTAYLVSDHQVGLELAIVASIAVASLFGLVLGLVSTRVGGDYFALASLAFTVAMYEFMQNATTLTRGRAGFYGIPPQEILGISLNSFRASYYAAWAVLVATCLVVAAIAKSFLRRSFLAVRYDEQAAAAAGVDPAFTKLLAMGLSGALAGLAGSVLAATVLFVRPQDFDLLASFSVMLWVMLGGMTSIGRVALAAAAVSVATTRIYGIQDYSVGLLGILVLLVVYKQAGVLGRLARRGGQVLVEQRSR